MTGWPAVALAVAAGLLPGALLTGALLTGAALAQAVPGVFSYGEIEVGLSVLTFGQDDVMSVTTFALDDLQVLEVRLSPDLATEIAALTRGKIGYEATLRVCGKTVMRARLQDELVETVVLFTSKEHGEVEAAAALLRNPPCSEL